MLRLAILLLCSMLSVKSAAQAWPDKPIRLIVGFTPGGLIDTFARTLQPRLAEGLGQPVIIDNRGGAGGTLAEAMLAKSAPDGYTLMLSADSPPANPHLYRNLSYDLFRDLAPVTMLVRVPLTLVVHPSVPAGSLAEFVTYVRARQGQFAYATTGNGTSNHLSMEVLKRQAGFAITHVPYKGGAQVMTDLMGGQVPSSLISITLAAPQVRAGKIRAVALTGDKRAPLLPDVQTFREGGYADILGQWAAVFVPAGTPPAIVQRLHADLARAIRSPEVTARFQDLGAEIVMNTPAELAAFLRSEHQRIGELVKEQKISAD